MTELDARSMSQLKALAPAVDPISVDWEDVLGRVRTAERAFFRRRRVALAFAVAALLVALAVPPLGLGSRLLEFFGVSAPAEVRDAVGRQAEPRESVVDWLNDQASKPGLDAASVHGVIELRTDQGLLRLWGARSKDGDTLYRFIQMPAAGRPTGIFTGMASGAPSPLDAGVVTRYDYPLLDAPLLHGQVRAPVASVIVRYDDGRAQRIPVVENYLLASLSQSSGGGTVEARDGQGQIVGSQQITLDPPTREVVTATRRLIDLETTEGPATLWVEPGANPERCYRVVARNGGTESCGPPNPVNYGLQQVGDRADRVLVLLHGSAPHGTVSMRVRLPTGWVPVTLKEGFFLHALQRDDRPAALELQNASGEKTLVRLK